MITVPDGGFRLLLADPPWRFKVYDRATGLAKSPDRHYKTMELGEICRVLPSGILAKNGLLAIWGYDPMLPDVFTVAKAWGYYTYITVLFRWLKTTSKQRELFQPDARLGFGTGYHTRGGACEECYLFRRGTGLKVLRHDIRKEFYAPLREHSRKPDEVRGWLVDLYGDVPRLEMFATSETPGWTPHGDQVGKYASIRA